MQQRSSLFTTLALCISMFSLPLISNASNQRKQELCQHIKNIQLGRYACIKRFPDIQEQVERIYKISKINEIEQHCPNMGANLADLDKQLEGHRFTELSDEDARKVCTDEFHDALRQGEKYYLKEIEEFLKLNPAK